MISTVIRTSSYIACIAGIVLLMGGLVGGCANKGVWRDPGYTYKPRMFRAAIRKLAPSFSNDKVVVPFEVPRHAINLAREKMRLSPSGLSPVEGLVSIITAPKPEGLALEYDWSASLDAKQAIKLGRGDCVALAMVLVGLGRSLDWPIYFAEARPNNPVTRELGELNVLSSHMIVIVLTQSGPAMIDFLGLIEKSEYEIHPIDDIKAYAHLLNNITAHSIASNSTLELNAWQIAKREFDYVTQIQPNFGHAWNNLGIALTRLDQFEDARMAYNRSSELDPSFGSSSRNLTILETRASGKTTISMSQKIGPRPQSAK